LETGELSGLTGAAVPWWLCLNTDQPTAISNGSVMLSPGGILGTLWLKYLMSPCWPLIV